MHVYTYICIYTYIHTHTHKCKNVNVLTQKVDNRDCLASRLCASHGQKSGQQSRSAAAATEQDW